MLGARGAKFAIKKHASKPIGVEILNVDELPPFQSFAGIRFLLLEVLRCINLCNIMLDHHLYKF